MRASHEAMSCLNMNECCVNASAVIFRHEQIPVCCCCVFSRSSRECCYCYGILRGGNTLKCLCLSKSPGNMQKSLYLHGLFHPILNVLHVSRPIHVLFLLHRCHPSCHCTLALNSGTRQTFKSAVWLQMPLI